MYVSLNVSLNEKIFILVFSEYVSQELRFYI